MGEARTLVDRKRRSLRRIINFATQLEGGGAQMVAAQLRDGFLQLGFEASLLAFLYEKRSFELPGPKPIILAQRKPRLFQLPGLCAKILKLLWGEKPDVVISHSVYTNLLVLPIAAILGIPHRVTVQHNETQDVSFLVQKLYALFHLIGISTHTVFVSDAAHRTYLDKFKCFKNGSSVVKNVISLAWDSADSEGLESANLQTGERLLFCVGRLSRQKNHAVLIEAMKEVRGCKLVIAGEGELRLVLEEQIKAAGLQESILLLGEIPRERIVALFGVCDVFVMPSLYEGRSLAMLEAAEAGCVIVASKIPSFEELLHSCPNEVSFFDVDSPADLANKINSIVASLPQWRGLDERIRSMRSRAEDSERSVNLELSKAYCEKNGWLSKG